MGLTAALTSSALPAADYDLFMNPAISDITDTSLPKVLIVLDNSANWSSTAQPAGGSKDSKYAFEKSALSSFFSALGANAADEPEYNVGLMLFSESAKSDCEAIELNSGEFSDGGGYVRFAVREMDGVNAEALSDLISNLDENDDKSNNTEYAHALHEAYLYFEGLQAYTGVKARTDDGQDCRPYNVPDYTPGDTGAWSALGSYTYQSPDAINSCGNKYVIVIANGKADSGENNAAEDLLDEFGGTVATDPINLSPKNEEDIWADEYARFLYQNGIHTYVIEVVPDTKTNPGKAVTALYKSMANQGRGRYFGIDEDGGDISQQIIDTLTDIFNEIQAVSSVYAASALPISVNVRGTNENQVYLGMFRPDGAKRPRWVGNLKEYELRPEEGTGALKLHDRDGKLVQSPITGFVNDDVTSYWTTPSTYWTPEPSGEGGASDAPDGEIVEKGAAAQQQRTQFGSRNIYTCIGCTDGASLSGQAFAATNTSITPALLGAADSTEVSDIIDWVRGADNLNEFDSADPDAPRPGIHSDIVHASPALVNYGDGLIVAYYGDNGGLYHAVRGGKTEAGSGQELWAFVAEEFLGKLKRQRDNSPIIKVPHDNPNPTDATATNRDFFFDGGTAIYRKDVDDDGIIESDDGDLVYIYLTARRGGRFIYAIDVTTPSSPVLLWHRNHSSTGWSELGQTWSIPKVVTLSIGGTDTPALVFGAGYDTTADDALPAVDATIGRGVFVVNATNGDIIRLISDPDMQAIPSDVAVVDITGDEIADVAYVGDTGGQLWRINFTGTAAADWTVAKFASFAAESGQDRPKFLYPPDLARFDDDCNGSAGDNTIAVMIGTGDREHPLAKSVYNGFFGSNLAETQDRFFLIKDQDYTASISAPITLSHLTDLTNSNTTNPIVWDAVAVEGSPAAPCGSDVCGWYVDFESGEKIVGNPLIIGGVATFGTSLPPATEIDPDTCAGNLGQARVYQINYCDAQAYPEGGSMTRYNEIPGGGLLPPPVPAVLEIDGEVEYAVVLGLNVFDAPTPETGSSRLGKTFWYRLRED